ncbi:hypothetical protein SNEBB_004040 [Seison nebaliae]|nr:hypothetical protein SNEBB_004040 [Seison nebaliae]
MTEEQQLVGWKERTIPDVGYNFFSDGKTKIDFVLVYSEHRLKSNTKLQVPNNGTEVNSNDVFLSDEGETKLVKGDRDELAQERIPLKRKAKQNRWRKDFLQNLEDMGILVEERVESSKKRNLHFLLLHLPEKLLLETAEKLCIRAPIDFVTRDDLDESARIFDRFNITNMMKINVPTDAVSCCTCTFKETKKYVFLKGTTTSVYFSNAQRSFMLHDILQSIPFGDEAKAEVGIDRLIAENVFTAAYSLHEGDFEDHQMKEKDVDKKKHAAQQLVAINNDGETKTKFDDKNSDNNCGRRRILFDFWANYVMWYKYQPLDHIREYLGEKIAFYFAYLGLYTAWLLPAAFVGVLVFLFGFLGMKDNTPAVEICGKSGNISMCPACDEKFGCEYWKLNEACTSSRISYLFDNPGTVFYSIFMSFWAVAFLEFWKRKNVSLAHRWDCLDYEEEEARPRPEFALKAKHLEKNPITGILEPSFPEKTRTMRIAVGMLAISSMIVLVIIFIFTVIVYRILISIPLFLGSNTHKYAKNIASLSGAILNLIIILLLGRIYQALAKKLTAWEMHRTQTDYDNNYTMKVFCFQFLNFYSSLIYVAFAKGRFIGYPGKYIRIFGLRQEECSPTGCMAELTQQLAVIMIGKQLINNVQEVMLPKAKAAFHHFRSGVKNSKKTFEQYYKDYKLIDNEGLFEEYLEMVLQFGFITIFVAAFPLAPLFALINNWIEIRLDAQKFICETRRSLAHRAQDIGVWFNILEAIAQIAVISNAFLIAFTSNFLPKLLYQFEHNGSLAGYIDSTLSTSATNTTVLECRYRDYRHLNGTYTPTFWKLLALRLVFIIVFEHTVFGITRLIEVLVPDVPKKLEVLIKRERYLAKQALADSSIHSKTRGIHKSQRSVTYNCELNVEAK